jgi:hypothetical protein
MDIDARFWGLIERATPKGGAGTEDHVDAIEKALRDLTADELVKFQGFVSRQTARAYRWDLWAVAYIALGGCGDDGFEYFRLWLVAQGRAYFERALSDPERAADALSPGDEGECESLGYAAAEAYEAKFGREIPYTGLTRLPPEPVGEPWPEEDVEELYPDLAARFD